MNWLDLVALLALGQYFLFASLVGRARGKYGVKAPAVTGHEVFERFYRVQMNTLELLVIFIPSLLLAAKYFPANWVAAVGAVYLLGRAVYAYAYVKQPAGRALGFVLSAGPTMCLLLMALVGVLRQA
ncbi:putative membrane protein YecN with MAPEG domain [Paucibacter oligotrophus]|uniref:Putative membrane protein YecN with MAPEG domain n=1 Tax=Roseateles oligotrophus TaxID=1769250 RepID=A0A840LB72_9BURK|nr:putative membrane protein YecN with MAPEG domain [Roseateles oligotrophus]